MGDIQDFKEVLVLYKESDVAIVRSLLEAEGIEYFIENENFSQMHGASVGMGVRVAQERFDEAKEILKSFL